MIQGSRKAKESRLIAPLCLAGNMSLKSSEENLAMKATAREKLTHLKSNGFSELKDYAQGSFLCENTPENLT
jgi:hypothetical protein